MVREEHFTFASGHGAIQSHGMRWIPDQEVRAVLQISHGMCEYIGRYRGFAEYFAERGILVVGHDHLGHGGSAPTQKDYGYFAPENGNKILVEDIHRVLRLTKRNYKKVPYILLGHSMGSFLARQYLCVYGKELDGAVICGTGYQSGPVVRLGMTLARSEARMRGWEYRSRLLLQMTFGNYNMKFRPNRTEYDWLCRDEAVVDAYIADPQCGIPFTLNGYYNLFEGLSKIVRSDYLQRMPKKLPVLFVSGAEDPVGGYGKGVRKVEQLFRKYGMEDVECRLYPQDRHELLNELDKEQVYADILGWMQERGLV